MDKVATKRIVVDAIELANQCRSDDIQIPISDDTVLFGTDGHLDSMVLVALLMDIEDALAERGIHVSISDEKAMSESRSPFTNLNTLTDYVFQIIQKQ